MVKNKQFTKNVRKGTLIALSVGMGAGAVIPGVTPAIEAHASGVTVQGVLLTEAELAVDKARRSLVMTDYESAVAKVNELSASKLKTDLLDDLGMVLVQILEVEYQTVKVSNHYDTLANFAWKFTWIKSTRADVVEAKEKLEREFYVVSDAYMQKELDVRRHFHLYNTGFSKGMYDMYYNFYMHLSPEGKLKNETDYKILRAMSFYPDIVKAVETAEKTSSSSDYTNAVNRVESLASVSSTYILVDYLRERLSHIGTATVNATNLTDGVQLDFESLVPEGASFEVHRNGKAIYEGSETSFIDKTNSGNTEYMYNVRVLNSDGDVIGSARKYIKTLNYITASLILKGDDVHVEMGTEREGEFSYEIKDAFADTLYRGDSSKWVDKNAVGGKSTSYMVVAYDSDGNSIGWNYFNIKLPVFSPNDFQVETKSPTSVHATWGMDKNPNTVEYMVKAVPKGEDNGTNEVIKEGFESATAVISRTGNWSRITQYTKGGTYGLRSAYIGHNGSTTATFTINVPESVSNSSVSFDSRVSSEAYRDYLTASLNGTTIQRIAGDTGWVNTMAPLKPGKNVLTLTYSKDGSVVKGLDAAFVDNLEVTYKNDGSITSGWVRGNQFTLNGLVEGKEYDISIVSRVKDVLSESVMANQNNASQEAADAIDSLTDVINSLDMNKLENVADAQEQLDSVKELADTLPESPEKEALLAQIRDIQESLDNAKALAEATEAVDAFIDALPVDLSTQEAIDEATSGLNEVQEMVEALVDTEEKDALVERLTDVKTAIELAQDVMNATEAVFGLMDAIETLETQEAIDEATALLENAQDLVSLLPADNTARVELEKGLAEAQQAVELAQKVVDAKEAVDTLKDAVGTLQTQEDIDQALVSLETAKELVALLPVDHAVRVELEKEMAVAEETIDVAQAVLDVAKLADAPTQAEIDKARESLEKVEDGDVKEALLEKIELAQAVLDAKTLLEEIATREINTTEQVDQAIADLKSTDKLIASLEGTFLDGEKSALEQAYSQATKQIADEFLALLEDNKNQKGKKEKLSISDASLHLLVQQLVAENPEITKGDLKGQLQPLLASSVTGKQLNDVIAVYVN